MQKTCGIALMLLSIIILMGAGKNDEIAQKLIQVGIDQKGAKHTAAVIQLRQIAQEHPLEHETIMMLQNSLKAALAYQNDSSELSQILATDVPTRDLMEYESFKTNWEQLASTVFVNQPDPKVTQGFQDIANDAKAPLRQRQYARIYLAARGDKKTDWMAMVVKDFRDQTFDPYEAGLDFRRYRVYLFQAIGKLPDWRAIKTVCLEKLPKCNWGEGEVYLGILQDLANSHPDFTFTEAERVVLLNWLTTFATDDYSKFVNHLVLACLGVDCAKELPQVLEAAGTGEDNLELTRRFFKNRLGKKEVQKELQKNLLATQKIIRLGALRVVMTLGPDAREMLPEIQKLLLDPNPDVREMARQVFEYTAGVDISGKWNVEVKPEYVELMKKSREFKGS